MYTYVAHVDNKTAFLRRLINYTPENIVSIQNENMFFVLLKGTHGGGYYFVGHINERKNHIAITGDIVHNPDRNGNPKTSDYTFDEKIRDCIQITIGFILCWWVLIILVIIDLFSKLFAKGKDLTLDEILDEIMINSLGCEKADELQK